MLPLMQIAIYVGVVILVLKAVEIFQMAYLSESPKRKTGLIIAVAVLFIAGVCGSVAIVTTELVARQLVGDLFNFPMRRY